MPDDELLNVRICDLGLKIEGTALQSRIERLYDELESRGIRFRPHCWLAEEWFSPDGIPGIAIPFFLAHRRLVRLERKFMCEVEGGTEAWFMKILRHEAGHALDTAYGLFRRRRYRELFGRHTVPYPEYYRPKPFSKRYVQHLDLWYAQSHPVEDFAETFAEWLRSRTRWRGKYRGWPALAKLEYVDQLMEEIAGKPTRVRSREHVDPVRTIRTTLGEHYQRKRERYSVSSSDSFDEALNQLFSPASRSAKRMSAAMFICRHRRELRRVIAQWTGQHQYTVDQVLTEMVARCRELNLRLDQPEAEVKSDAMVMLTVQTMNYLQNGHHRLAL